MGALGAAAAEAIGRSSVEGGTGPDAVRCYISHVDERVIAHSRLTGSRLNCHNNGFREYHSYRWEISSHIFGLV
jgi:hypothetical protein